MLQDPLYWSQPKSLTFGAFGIVVGKGILYQIKGQRREILNILSPETEIFDINAEYFP
jgi:hypothetical protein